MRERLERKKREAEIAEKRELLEEQRKAANEKKVHEWLEKKRVEAEEKMSRMSLAKKKLDEVMEKPKEFKKAINFDDWISQKKQNFEAEKKRHQEAQKAARNIQTSREVVAAQSFDKWIRSASARTLPVRAGQGLKSLRGSSTKIYVNPQPWVVD
jgi:coiled-coil domain-containing protein 34